MYIHSIYIYICICIYIRNIQYVQIHRNKHTTRLKLSEYEYTKYNDKAKHRPAGPYYIISYYDMVLLIYDKCYIVIVYYVISYYMGGLGAGAGRGHREAPAAARARGGAGDNNDNDNSNNDK